MSLPDDESRELLSSVKPLGKKLIIEIQPVVVSKLLLTPQPLHHFDGGVRTGKVLSVGPKVNEVKQGDIIRFRADAGRWVLSDDFRCLSQDDVIAIE